MNHRIQHFLRYLVPAFGAVVFLLAGFPAFAAEHVSFKKDILPIFQARCVSCHQPGQPGFEASGLDLRTYAGLMKGTKFGAIVVPGDAFMSNLNVLIEGRADPAIRMPHNQKPLSWRVRDLIKRWVDQGARNN